MLPGGTHGENKPVPSCEGSEDKFILYRMQES